MSDKKKIYEKGGREDRQRWRRLSWKKKRKITERKGSR